MRSYKQTQQSQNLSQMSDDERKLYDMGQQLKQTQDQIRMQESLWKQQYMNSEIDTLDKRFEGNLKPIKDKVLGFVQASVNRGVSAEGAFKALDYDEAVKRAEEKGFQRGLGVKQTKLSQQPITQSVHSASSTQPSSTKFKDITDKAKQDYYATHGRL